MLMKCGIDETSYRHSSVLSSRAWKAERLCCKLMKFCWKNICHLFDHLTWHSDRSGKFSSVFSNALQMRGCVELSGQESLVRFPAEQSRQRSSAR